MLTNQALPKGYQEKSMVPFAMIPKPTGTALVKRTHPLSMNIQFKWPDPQNFLSKSSVYLL